ncbi:MULTISPECIES: 6-phosphogluconolactonase [unclassified Gilliamella]|uniref:6-phosphogluconolactonase n=1 Tax=unclassified Gilliamella TaxID=2685620 RepID=UPI00226A54DA|nr:MULTISPECIES: 6-phosphogluconolactonase [unclassified Gilliamella]MCX8642109.1 6-phosphogluconolactonase [Gilliamella sp. B3835]MCX8707295.1 6-phosphogluconolactonase [Gilliamella sp. B3783]MCX8710796.1 6-phosphogluconolactonase [Gilliamella sp. B3780]MCX8711797.1 6-phosphogluconolactonase [Gilliamella sp. B3468]MCX8713964.1 6-phosphogluconolactonase [Gilliamella sp. B3781]
MVTLNKYATSELLVEDLTSHIVNELTKAIQIRGQASIAVSGGKTPIPLFIALSEQNLDWSRVFITLVDDRWVDDTDDASNEKLVMTYLLQNKAKLANFIGLKNSCNNPFDGASITEKQLDKVPMPFDVLILGMGEDGHTASLFPGAANLAAGLDMKSGRKVIGMTPLTAPLDRITLTLPTILNSHNIYLHLVGDSKMSVLEQAEQGKDINQMPVRAILQQDKVNVTIFWTAA